VDSVTRDEALEILKTPSYEENTVEKEMEYISKKLGVPLAEFKSIVDLPGHWYKE
jgi:hypothetical protein